MVKCQGIVEEWLAKRYRCYGIAATGERTSPRSISVLLLPALISRRRSDVNPEVCGPLRSLPQHTLRSVRTASRASRTTSAQNRRQNCERIDHEVFSFAAHLLCHRVVKLQVAQPRTQVVLLHHALRQVPQLLQHLLRRVRHLFALPLVVLTFAPSKRFVRPSSTRK